ncbi:MAG TPA: hypothetical protein VGN85_10470 [Methyloceanibacter sp.]|jgi:hypothetical protein|nr:hypothetical protein [Methyloceanibacter sp.]
MQRLTRLLGGVALVTAPGFSSTAWAQDQGTQVIGGTIITLGGGA